MKDARSTPFTCTVYSVSQNIPLGFSDIFPKQLGIFRPNFTHLFYVPIYAHLRIFYPFICKFGVDYNCDHPARVSTDGGHFVHIMVVVLNMA